jgi:transcriptional regulator with XRE-family HTH domain
MSYRLRVDKLLAAARARGDDSGYAIAQRSGVSEPAISRLLRGDTRPGVLTLLRFRAVYGGTLDDLIEETAA